MNNSEHEIVLGMLADYAPQTPSLTTEDGTPLVLDELTKELGLLRRGLEEHNRTEAAFYLFASDGLLQVLVY